MKRKRTFNIYKEIALKSKEVRDMQKEYFRLRRQENSALMELNLSKKLEKELDELHEELDARNKEVQADLF